jgi:hypothetical protein
MMRRSGAIALDQGLYAISNFALQFGVLRAAGTAELAAFSVGYATYWLAAGSARAFFGESQLVLVARNGSTAGAIPSYRWLAGYASLGLCAGLVTSALVREDGRLVAAAMAVAIPVTIVADFVRYGFIARRQLGRVLFFDGVWLLIQVGLFATLFGMALASAHLLVIAWAGSALLAVMLLGLKPLMEWKRSAWDSRTGRGMAAEFLVSSGIQQALPWLLYGAGFIAPLAALRAAQTLVSPLNTIFTAGTTIAYSRMGGRESALRTGVVLGTALSGVVTVYGVAMLAAPPELVRTALGESAILGLSIVGLVLLQVAANGLTAGGLVASRILRTPGANFRSRLWTAPVLLLSPLIGVELAGTTGLAWGLLIGSAVTSVIWWSAVARARRGGAK